MPKQTVTLMIIDPQVDFCSPTGSLYVTGAENDSARLAKMIEKNIGDIDDIHVTLDSHHLVHIAHPIFWVDSMGKHPTPFTLISADDVRKGKWMAFNPGYRQRAKEYVEKLEINARYPLVIWPPHCLIGSQGAAIMPEIFEQLISWESQFAIVNKVPKGSNPFSEHYSAVRADVEDPADPTTMLNTDLIRRLQNIGDQKILIAGQALSHCVANTVRDIAKELDPAQVKNIVLLEDACSNVSTFEKMGQDFITELVALGMQVSTTEKFFA